jgi:DNA-binding transcriptional regulator/RsmH inhibitor MraZ
MYKKFQESVLDTPDASLMVDGDDNHLISSTMYDNLNEFIKNFEARELAKKEKRKLAKEGLEKFVENEDDNEGRV